ncbi:MAG: hypothetical protein IJF33_00585 [Clostridia bacterium]|nr:hypothetical protein [Clostridia bacterium]
MRKYSSIVALLLALAMLLSFAACGNKNNNNNETSGTESNSESSSESGSGEGDIEDDIVVETFEGNYTWNDAVSTLATNWNPHTYETADDSYPLDFIVSGLYTFVFNDELNPVEGKDPYTGYKIIPEMAAALPVDVTEEIKALDNNKYNIPAEATTGYAYRIALNKAATWQDGTPITADTYVNSMERLFRSSLINYRATDYMDGDLAIAGGKAYWYSGRTAMTNNSANGETMDYAFSALVKDADGNYSTPDGAPAYFGLNEGYAWMNGNSLAAYAGAGYIPEAVWTGLTALADDDGFVRITDAAIELLFTFTNSDVWDNETKDDLGYYVTYNKTYDTFEFENVGIIKNDDYTITIVLEKSLSGFYLLYNLTGNWLVYEELYDSCLTKVGDAYVSTYNTSVETTMSYGPYKMTEYQEDKGMTFVKNENWYGHTDDVHIYKDPEDELYYRMYQTTKVECQVVAEAETRKLMFLKGQLMGYGLQADDYDTYRSSDRCYATPATSTFFLILNGHINAIQEREAAADFNKATHDLETLTLKSFKQAMALVYDRDLFAATVSPSRSAGYGIIGDAYIYDPDTGAKYRDTDAAKKVLCDFYSVNVEDYDGSLDAAVEAISGFDVAGAKNFFQQAFEESLAAGYITDTNNDGKCDQMIRIEYASSATSDFMVKTINYMNEKLNEAIAGTPFEGKIEIYESAPYGNEWSNKIKAGLSDTVLGGWQGSALNPFSLTDLYVNPARAYNANWFNPNATDLTIEINGEEITMNLYQWSDALNGAAVEVGGKSYNFGDGQADIEVRLQILAAFEGAILQTYDYLPVLQDGSMALLSHKVFYVVEEYNSVMGRGGMAYAKYNFTDEEWAEYVASEGGELKY